MGMPGCGTAPRSEKWAQDPKFLFRRPWSMSCVWFNKVVQSLSICLMFTSWMKAELHPPHPQWIDLSLLPVPIAPLSRLLLQPPQHVLKCVRWHSLYLTSKSLRLGTLSYLSLSFPDPAQYLTQYKRLIHFYRLNKQICNEMNEGSLERGRDGPTGCDKTQGKSRIVL